MKSNCFNLNFLKPFTRIALEIEAEANECSNHESYDLVDEDKGEDRASEEDPLSVILMSESLEEAATSTDACTLLMMFFYRTSLTQSDFDELLAIFNLFSSVSVPNDFDLCARQIMPVYQHLSDYVKQWYCLKCCSFIQIEKYQRKCLQCNQRFVFFSFMSL